MTLYFTEHKREHKIYFNLTSEYDWWFSLSTRFSWFSSQVGTNEERHITYCLLCTVQYFKSYFRAYLHCSSNFILLSSIIASEWLISLICCRMEVRIWAARSSLVSRAQNFALRYICPWNICRFIASHRYLTRVQFQQAPTLFLEQSLYWQDSLGWQASSFIKWEERKKVIWLWKFW